MEKLEIYPGKKAGMMLSVFEGLKPTPLREYDSMVLRHTLGKLKKGTELKGQFYLTAERAYGRVTRAFPKEGGSYTVCLEVLDNDWKRGLKRAPLAESPGSTMVWPSGYVEAVERFE
jgi:hypothetical protein